MNRLLFLALLSICFSSCTQYFICSDNLPVQAYSDENLSDATFKVPNQKQFLIKSKKRKNKILRWDQWNGFVSKSKIFASQQKISKKKISIACLL